MPDLIQRSIAAIASVLTLPLIVALAVLIRVDSPGWPFYRARRVGAGGRSFDLIKLRTMSEQADRGPGITASNDARITRVGGFLRRHRVDELPQLWNVALGQMRLVGPRPEDPRYVDYALPGHDRVFTAKPGITGPTQLAFASEAALLDPHDPDGSYRNTILPAKVALDERYLAVRSGRLDAWILLQTVAAALGRAPTLEQVEAHLRTGYGPGDEPAA